ncbi:MAG: TonB-dependent receptor [Robiginitomaculum sp.]|nr:MAG: TonB-dependent receptor [Robiginitomaculum sp.]
MKKFLIVTSASAALLMSTGVQVAFAQSQTVNDEVIVTGSRIKRSQQKDKVSPVVGLDQETFNNVGAKDIRDVIETLTINTGSQSNADVFTQNITAGTSNINLRGLGIASTLVLLNGRRQVQAAVQASDGVSFVDTASLIPSIAIKRLEILKDGASAIYGSEAVAGVANFLTRDDFVGVELQADAQLRATNGSQTDLQFSAIVGTESDYGNLVFAVSYFDRTELDGTEVDFLVPINNSSGAGNPGRFITSGGVVVDPDCVAAGGIPTSNNCLYDFGPNQSFVPEETRIQAYASHKYDFNDSISSFVEATYSQNRTERNTSASFPTLFSFPIVSAGNPGNTFGEDVRFIGRPLGNGSPPARNFFNSDTVRIVGGLNGNLNGLDWEVSVTHAINDFQVILADTITENYQQALLGFGGNDCDASQNTPGLNGCLYFNPAGSAISDPTLANSAEVIDYIIGDFKLDARSKTTVVDAVVSKRLFALSGGDAAIAVGLQLRSESLRQDFDDISNQDGFSFLLGNPDFTASRNASAVFAELVLPVTDKLEVQFAGRYEKIGDLDTFDPKVAARYSINDNMSVRGSWSTSFRAPSLFQQGGTQTSFFQLDTNGDAPGGNTFISVRSAGDPSLVPETSTAFNIGGSYEAESGFVIDVDYWDFNFENVLTQESAQAIFDADPNDPRITRLSSGTVALVTANFVNASAINTNGVDIAIKRPIEMGFGTITPSVEGTYIFNYDLNDPQAGAIEGAGQRNFRNFGTSTPELRINGSLSFVSSNGNHTGNVFARYVDSYFDDQNSADIKSIVTFDAQYNYSLGNVLGGDSNTVLTVGALNIFDEDPPFVATNGNYDTKVGDPRGRRLYVRAKVGF